MHSEKGNQQVTPEQNEQSHELDGMQDSSKNNSLERTIKFFYESMVGILLVLNSSNDNSIHNKNWVAVSSRAFFEAAQFLGFVFQKSAGSLQVFTDVFQFFHIEPILTSLVGYPVVLSTSILIVLSLFVNGLYVGYRWAIRETQSAWAVASLRAIVNHSTGSFYTPILLTLSRPLHCQDLSLDPMGTTEQSCAILAPFTIILSVMFVLVSFAMTSSFYDSSLRSKSSNARPHARVDLALLAFKTITVVMWRTVRTGPGYSTVSLLLFTGYLAIQFWVLCLLFIWYQPYYNEMIVRLKAMTLSVVAWAAVSEFGRVVLRSAATIELDEAGTIMASGQNNSIALEAMESYFEYYNGMMLVITAIPLPLVVYLMLGYRHITLARTPFHQCRHEYEFELKVRLKLRKLHDTKLLELDQLATRKSEVNYKQPTNNSAEDGDTKERSESFSKNHVLTPAQELEAINVAFQEALKKFSSPILCVFYLEFLQSFPLDGEQSLLMRSVILEAESRSPILDVQFALLRKREQLKRIVDQHNGIRNYVRSRRLEAEARGGDQRACMLLVEFWDLLQEKDPEMAKIKPLATRISDSTYKARTAYLQLLKHHKNNISTLKLYAGFAADVYNSSTEATTYTLRANRIEAGQQVVLREPSKGRVRLDESWGIIEFDVMGIHHPFGDILSTNQVAARVLNEPSNGLAGKDIASYLVPPFSTNLQQVIRGYLETGKSKLVYQTLETHCISSQGNCFSASLRLLPFSEDGIYYTCYANLKLVSSEGCFLLLRKNGRVVGASAAATEFFASCCSNSDGVVVPTKLNLNQLFQPFQFLEPEYGKGRQGAVYLAFPRDKLQQVEGHRNKFKVGLKYTSISSQSELDDKDYSGPHAQVYTEPIEFGENVYYYKLVIDPIVEPGRRFNYEAEKAGDEEIDLLVDSVALETTQGEMRRDLSILREELDSASESSRSNSSLANAAASQTSESASEDTKVGSAGDDELDSIQQQSIQANTQHSPISQASGFRLNNKVAIGNSQDKLQGKSRRKDGTGSVASSTMSSTRHAVHALRSNLQRQSYNNALHPTLSRLRRYYVMTLIGIAALCFSLHSIIHAAFAEYSNQVSLTRMFGIRRFYVLSIAYETLNLVMATFGVQSAIAATSQAKLLEVSTQLLSVEENLFENRDTLPPGLRNMYEKPTVMVNREQNGYLHTEPLSVYDASMLVGGMGKQLGSLSLDQIPQEFSMVQSLFNTIGQQGEGLLESYSNTTRTFTDYVQHTVIVKEYVSLGLGVFAFLVQSVVLLLVLFPAADRIENNKSQVLLVFSGIPRNSVKTISMRYRIRLAQVHDITLDDTVSTTRTKKEQYRLDAAAARQRNQELMDQQNNPDTIPTTTRSKLMQLLCIPLQCCKRLTGRRSTSAAYKVGPNDLAKNQRRNKKGKKVNRMKQSKSGTWSVIAKLATVLGVTAMFFIVYLSQGVFSQNVLMLNAPHWMEVNSRKMAELRGGMYRMLEFIVGLQVRFHDMPPILSTRAEVIAHMDTVEDLTFQLNYGGFLDGIQSTAAKSSFINLEPIGVLEFEEDIGKFHTISYSDGCLDYEPLASCEAVNNGLMNRGLMNAIRQHTSKVRDAVEQIDAAPKRPFFFGNSTTLPEDAVGYFFSYDLEYINATIHTSMVSELETLEAQFLQVQLDHSIELLERHIKESVGYSSSLRTYLLVGYIVLVLLLYLTVIRQVIMQLDKEVKQTRSLLLMIPEDTLEGLGSLQEFLMHEFRQYAVE